MIWTLINGHVLAQAAGMSGEEGDAGDETEEVAARKKALGALVGDGGAPVPIAQQVRGHTSVSPHTRVLV